MMSKKYSEYTAQIESVEEEEWEIHTKRKSGNQERERETKKTHCKWNRELRNTMKERKEDIDHDSVEQKTR